MPIKAIIIDDERLARNELKKLLEQYPMRFKNYKLKLR